MLVGFLGVETSPCPLCFGTMAPFGTKARKKVTEWCCRADGGTENLSVGTVCLSGGGHPSFQPLWCIVDTKMGSPRAWRRGSHHQGEKGLGNNEMLSFPKRHEAASIYAVFPTQGGET